MSVSAHRRSPAPLRLKVLYGEFVPRPDGAPRRAGVALVVERPPPGQLLQIRRAGQRMQSATPWRTVPIPKDIRNGPDNKIELFLSYEEAHAMGFVKPDADDLWAGKLGLTYQARHMRQGQPS